MNKVKLLGVTLGLSAIFASCSSPQTGTASDLFGVKDIETNVVTLAKNDLVAQAATGELNASHKLQDSTTWNKFTGVPSAITGNLDMLSVTFNAACEGAAPTTNFTVSNISVVVTDVGEPSKTVTITATPLTFTGTLTATGYSVSNVAGGNIAGDPVKIVDILKNPGTGINTVAMTMSLSAASDTLKNCSTKLKFGATKAEIVFRM